MENTPCLRSLDFVDELGGGGGGGGGRQALAEVTLENNRHFSTQNDVLRNELRNFILMTRTTQIWVVLLIGRSALEIYFSQSEALPRSG